MREERSFLHISRWKRVNILLSWLQRLERRIASSQQVAANKSLCDEMACQICFRVFFGVDVDGCLLIPLAACSIQVVQTLQSVLASDQGTINRSTACLHTLP